MAVQPERQPLVIRTEVRCKQCGCRARLDFEDTPLARGPLPAAWRCPLCRVVHDLPAFGRVLTVKCVCGSEARAERTA